MTQTNEFANKGDASHDMIRDNDSENLKGGSGDKHLDNHGQGTLRTN
jgi:hypothetical protein